MKYIYSKNDFNQNISCSSDNISVTSWNINLQTITEDWYNTHFKKLLNIENKICFFQEMKCIYITKVCEDNYFFILF